MSASNSDGELPEKGPIANVEGVVEFNHDERSAFLSSFTRQEEKSIMRKVDRRFLLLIGLMYLVKTVSQFTILQEEFKLNEQIDYSNASNVKVLQKGQPGNILVELDMTADQYNWVQSIYFVRFHLHIHLCYHILTIAAQQISYIIFEVPSNLLLKKFTPRLWQSRIIVTWGAVLACHAAVKDRQGLYAVRFILGM